MLIDAYLYYLNVNNYYDQTQDSFEWYVIQFYKGGLIYLREENKGFINFLPDKVNETL